MIKLQSGNIPCGLMIFISSIGSHTQQQEQTKRTNFVPHMTRGGKYKYAGGIKGGGLGG